MVLAHDVTGDGQAIVFLHAGLGDRRMWRPQWEQFAATNRLVRVDLPGFGDSLPTTEPFSASQEVIDALDQLGVEQAVFVGASMGGRVAMDVAVLHPERVTGLLLLGSARVGHEWSAAVQNVWTIEEAALEADDLDRAVQINLEFWLDGPNRAQADLSPADRQLVADMQRLTFEHERNHPDAARESRPQGVDERLGEISVPTRVLYGDQDADDVAEIARYLTARIAIATLHPIADAAHLPSFEQPGQCNAILADLLSDLR